MAGLNPRAAPHWCTLAVAASTRRPTVLQSHILERILRAEYRPDKLIKFDGQLAFPIYSPSGGLCRGLVFSIRDEGEFIIGRSDHWQLVRAPQPELTFWQHLRACLRIAFKR